MIFGRYTARRIASFIAASCLSTASYGATTPGASDASQAVDIFSLLRGAQISRIDGSYTSWNKANLDAASIDAKVAATKSSFEKAAGDQEPASSASLDLLLKKYRASLETGSATKCTFTLFVGATDELLNLKSTDSDGTQHSEWELQRGPTSIVWDDKNSVVTIYKRDLGMASDMGVLMHALDYLGKDISPSGTLFKLLSNAQGQKIFSDSSTTEAFQYAPLHNDLLQQKTIDVKDIQQHEVYSFADYLDQNGLKIPQSITYDMETADVSKKLDIHFSKIQSWAGPVKEIGLPILGSIRVEDLRFSPALHYNALDVLPNDETVAKFLQDPNFLDQFNTEISQRTAAQ